ncbi:hypothetical protein [Olleya sp. HaHaR_3_96]|uniref:hypothetical protein n=1 Tax=Olleya sp. HaHaR_3_96 TaxID=2745560 RepID=UPI001C4FE53C|nr:hypothetical protein [Olleya sp. HaHaR_3_96]QXP58781.1 hypothetical protein H0I26_12765 [Olleya sp. HaHaR_3_96]
MKVKQFKFRAFLVEKYYRMWSIFAVLLVSIIVVPGLLLANYFLPDDMTNTPLFSQLFILVIIAIPLMMVLFIVINALFFKTLNVSLGELITIQGHKKKLYQFNKKDITKIIIKSNDDKTIHNRFRILEMYFNENKSINIISRDKNQEGVFNNFLEACILYFDLNRDSAEKRALNTSGDYKLIFNLKN